MQMPPDIFHAVTLRRYAAGSYDANGRPVAGAESTVTITGCVEPGGMREILSLEEGDRTRDTLAIWSPDPIYTIDETTGQAADRIEWDGALWQVRKVERFAITPELNHYHAIAIREQMR